MLSPRAIAVRGYGFDVRLVAVRGYWPVTVTPPGPAPGPINTGGGGSGWGFPIVRWQKERIQIPVPLLNREDEEVFIVSLLMVIAHHEFSE